MVSKIFFLDYIQSMRHLAFETSHVAAVSSYSIWSSHNLRLAIITAMPFFLSRLAKSRLGSVFASYLVATMQLSRVPALVHATYTVKTVC